MKAPNIRLLSFFIAITTCLSVFFIGCEKKTETNNFSNETMETDPTAFDLLTQAFKKTNAEKSLIMSGSVKYDPKYIGEQEYYYGTFTQNEKGQLVAFLENYESSCYYEYDKKYLKYGINMAKSGLKTLDSPATIGTACIEDWVLPSFGFSDFETFAKAMDKAVDDIVTENGTTTISFTSSFLGYFRIAKGDEYEDWYRSLDQSLISSLKFSNSDMKIVIDENGRLSEFTLILKTTSGTTTTTFLLYNFGHNETVTEPNWKNEIGKLQLKNN